MQFYNEFSDDFEEKPKMNHFKRAIILLGGSFALFFLIILSFHFYAESYKNTEKIKALTAEETTRLNEILDENYTEKRKLILKELPYSVVKASLDVWAGSAILVDSSNGCVLFEKNADAIIPPASITKLFVMYIVFKEIAEGKHTLDDIVPLPEKSWAINMPKDASLMFLGQGQIVTLRELLKGLAVASGNDAALAVATYISGSTAAFVERMNEECEALGLKNTHFVEPSGYDEHNLTTARELAAFCTEYVTKYPESIEEFHSAVSIKYPMGKNLPSWEKSKGDSAAIYQKNTNPLLGKMEGVDGIKTGFIYESGYNLALTAMRDGVRFISITLKGPGIGGKQGNEGRVHDGTEMMEWAFETFADYIPPEKVREGFVLAAPGSRRKFVRLIPAWNNSITVPHISGATALDDAKSVNATVSMPRFISGGVDAGTVCGQLQYKLGDVVLETVPLVADRTCEKAGFFGRLAGTVVGWRL